MQDAELPFVLIGAAAYCASFGFRAMGWRRMFPRALDVPAVRGTSPHTEQLAASGAVLPFRLDYVVNISVLRRLRGSTLRLESIVSSIFALGILDSVAMLPLAISALATSGLIAAALTATLVGFGGSFAPGVVRTAPCPGR